MSSDREQSDDHKREGATSAVVAPPPSTSVFDFHIATLDNVYIAISGIIGAGKSTLAEALAKRLNLPVYHEPVVHNVYLEDFYKETKKYAFPMQVYLLNARFKQQQEIIWGGKGGVQDRSIYEDSIFAKVRSLKVFDVMQGGCVYGLSCRSERLDWWLCILSALLAILTSHLFLFFCLLFCDFFPCRCFTSLV